MRFDFGKNWQSFSLSALSKDRIAEGRSDFAQLFSKVPLKSKTFIDIGFGQGLALCFASELGAHCYGIDIDADNLNAFASTAKFFGLREMPKVSIGSILDSGLVGELASKGGFDVVHSWGVLHHTGNLVAAITNSMKLTKDDGFLVIAIYRSHWSSPLWKIIKWFYNISPVFIKKLLIWINYWLIYSVKWIVTGKDPRNKRRGMDFYYDIVDWVGGYPYEYADAKKVIDLIAAHGFQLIDFLPADMPTGCNQFVFQKKYATK